MKVLMIDGGFAEKNVTARVREILEDIFAGYGIETVTMEIGDGDMQGCVACGKCWKTGKCRIDDLVNQAAEIRPEGLILIAPAYYGELSGNVKNFTERLFHSASSSLYPCVASGIVVSRKGNGEKAWMKMVDLFRKADLYVVTEEECGTVTVLTEEEEIRITHLAENAACLIACLHAGKEAGIPVPDYKPKRITSYIR